MTGCEAHPTMYRTGENCEADTHPEIPSGEGLESSTMVKLIEESHASSSDYRPTGIRRSKHVPLCVHEVGQVTGLSRACTELSSHRRPDSTYGVQKVTYMERGKTVPSPCATYGRQTARHAVGGAGVRIRKKQRPSCDETDRVCNMAQRKIKSYRDLGRTCPRPTGVSSRENLGNLRRGEGQ
jgi:hypothetical protein